MPRLLAMKFLSPCCPGLSVILAMAAMPPRRLRPLGSTIRHLRFPSPFSESPPERFCFRQSPIQSSSSHSIFGSRLVSLHRPTSMAWESTRTPSAFHRTIQHLPSGLATRSVFQPGRTCMEITLCTLSIVRQVLMVFSFSTRMGWISKLQTMDLVARL